LLQRKWKTLYGLTLSGLGALVLYLPWGLQLPAQFSKVQSAYWVERPDISKIFTLLIVFITNTPLPASLTGIVLAIVLVITLVGLIAMVRYIRRTRQKHGLWLFYLSFAPPLLMFLFSQWSPVYIERALLPSGAVFCIWLAWVVAQAGMPPVAKYAVLFLLGFSSLLGIYQHMIYEGFPYGPFQALDRSVRERMEPGDAIVHASKLSALPAIVFDRALNQSFIADLPGSASDTLAPATQEVLHIRAQEDIRSATGNAPRVWYIIYERAIEEAQAAGRGSYPDLAYLDTEYVLELQESWDGLQVRLYAREP
jgi:hypothetical protein